ncbi:hypothetical protein AUC43_13135 [Hymenobacter sedentarius]|uniref:Secretion system C-terminal sorting domain-containing protein n=1 Tax=Hymenobacter sedentarius TaxID=1411621 RepID=A0A0U3SZK2_9BACT|nr:T9SS type A sorting domain-containing protein [Hymenobacter sedentarius]ALW85955.1 hypothetical protein AUC43_13135 [Hymenobacter sedentarius]
MKKTLLLLVWLGFAAGLHAQTPNLGPWVEVNKVGSGAFAPGYFIVDVKTTSPTIAWMVAEENSSAGKPTAFFVTNNAAGDQFNFGTVSAANGSQNYQTGNISSVGVSATTAVAATFPIAQGAAGGEILRTTNGGISWTKVTTASQFVGTQGGFCNFVHMFDASVGVSLGDPTNGYFEILRTTDGGLTWTRVPQSSIPAPLPNEFGLTRSFFARGNTIWAGLGSSNDNAPVRVLKSTDRGLTWTASAVTTLLGGITRLAFKDDLNGIAYNNKVANNAFSEVNVIRTSDGGATWSPITPVNTANGSFFHFDIDAVDGRYYSVGARFPVTTPTPVAADFGSSYSTDGINWTNLNNSQGFFSFDLISAPAGAPAGSATGYAGAATDANGVGGIFKASSTVTATRDAALQRVLSAYPNPSHSGVFKVELSSFLKGSAQLTVVDALGRQVQAQALSATAIGSRNVTLNMSGEKAGVYTLQVRTDAGIATQKLVID